MENEKKYYKLTLSIPLLNFFLFHVQKKYAQITLANNWIIHQKYPKLHLNIQESMILRYEN